MSETPHHLPWPGEKARVAPIVPVFLPFAGCRSRCVFCAQEAQTGKRAPASLADLGALLAEAEILAAKIRAQTGRLPELAFYGGTFTAQPPEFLNACLSFAQKLLANGSIGAFRCSTRPDSLNGPLLARLRGLGCRLVELGIQSFAESALAASRRGYDGKTARAALKLVKAAGLEAGAQLLPGLPGQKAGQFVADVQTALALGADCLRFYPCLVPAGTALAALWRAGRYRPWPLPLATRMLARGLLLANLAQVPVIRMGLAPQEGFEILAGPAHPSLGGEARARALLLGAFALARQAGAKPARCLIHAPKTARGYAYGQKNGLRPIWGRFGGICFDTREGLWLEMQGAPKQISK